MTRSHCCVIMKITSRKCHTGTERSHKKLSRQCVNIFWRDITSLHVKGSIYIFWRDITSLVLFWWDIYVNLEGHYIIIM